MGYHEGIPIARRDALIVHPDLMAPVPAPPAELIARTQDGQDADQYKSLGCVYYHQLRRAITRHRENSARGRLLDFGCGSGRVLAHFLNDPLITEAYGVDIDSEAIAWARAHLNNADFQVISKVPPLPFAAGAFDIVISLAVFAAFGAEEQKLWWPELRRVTAVGGLLLISIQGEFSASFLHPQRFMAALQEEGIIGRPRYEALKQSMSLGDYLGVYQTRAYTWREWSRYFEVLEHLVGEIGADQDLVVLRRRA
jgi:SAM-dependent methyltransferase